MAFDLDPTRSNERQGDFTIDLTQQKPLAVLISVLASYDGNTEPIPYQVSHSLFAVPPIAVTYANT